MVQESRGSEAVERLQRTGEDRKHVVELEERAMGQLWVEGRNLRVDRHFGRIEREEEVQETAFDRHRGAWVVGEEPEGVVVAVEEGSCSDVVQDCEPSIYGSAK